MKKILTSALLLSCVVFGSDAATYAYDDATNYKGTYALSSKANFAANNKTGTSSNYGKSGKYYLNAGHGGFDSDDRPTPMPLGVTQYYESIGNLDRALHLQQFIIQNGGSVKMSRTKNTSSDDLNLTSIATYSSSYGGYFISLHSNGANASANYHIALYKGSNSTNSVGGSQKMAYQNSYYSYQVNLSEYTYGTARSMADYDLMGWHYGVLRTNTAPGFLVETWFHDYRGEALRFSSSLYNKFLAWQMARAALDYPGGTGSLPACIVGDVRDVSKSCGYTNYTTRGRDLYKALNNVTVTLKNSSGATVATCNTGGNHNGVYAFFVPAGTYTIEAKLSGYKTATVSSFTVSANNQYEKSINMSEGVDTGISLNPTSTGFGETPVGNTSSKNITVTGTSLSANISITNSDNTNFSVSHTSLGTSGGTIKITYQPKSAGTHSTTLSFTSGTHKASMVVTGTAKNPPLSFTEGWNYSENSGKKAAWMANYTNYRNMAFGDGKLYVVDATNGVVKVLKAQTAEHIKDLDMTGVSGGALKLVDVAFVDGKLIGTNIAMTSNDSFKTLKVYIWDNDDAAPRVLLETTNLGSMDRIGDCIDVQGNLSSGKLCFLAQQTRDYKDKDGNTANGNCNSLVTYALTNGVASTTPVVADIDGFILGNSPRAVPDGNNFWVLGQHYHVSQITAGGELAQSIPSTVFNLRQTSDGCGNDFVPFKFKGAQYAFATDYAAVTDKDGNGKIESADVYATSLLGGRAVLIDGSEGWAVEGLKNSGNYPSNGMGSTTRNTSYSTSLCVNVNGDSGVEMWVLIHNQGIAYYKHGTAPTYEYEPVPEIDAPAQVEIKAIEGRTATETITVGGKLLTGNISVAISGNGAFKVDKTSLGTSGGTITVTYAPTDAGEHTATLTLTSEGAATKTVALKGTAEAAIAVGLTKVWQNTTKVPGSAAGGDVRFAGVSNGKLIANDKANKKIIEITETGYSDYYDPSAAITEYYSQTIGTAIACDDAGNILVNSGFSGAVSGKNFTIISADLKSTYKLDMSTVSGYTAARCDQMGRIVGNMLSDEGAYAFIVPNGATQVLIVKIVNGEIDASYSQLSTACGVTLSTSTIAQPAFATVKEIDALMDENGDLSNSFVLRNRSYCQNVYKWKEDASAMEAKSFTNSTDQGYTTKNASTEGFDWFQLYKKSYYIMPMTTDGTTTTRGSVFGIYDQDGNIVATWSEGEKTGLGAAMGSFIAVPNNDYSVFIYHFVPGTVAEKFTFAVEPISTGVENIEASVVEEAVEAPVEYYNLQGIKVKNPSNGIYIKVQGNKVSKVLIRE